MIITQYQKCHGGKEKYAIQLLWSKCDYKYFMSDSGEIFSVFYIRSFYQTSGREGNILGVLLK